MPLPPPQLPFTSARPNRPLGLWLLVIIGFLGLAVVQMHRNRATSDAERPAWISSLAQLTATPAADMIEAVAALPESAFSPLAHGLSAGYGLKPHWLKVRLERHSDAPKRYWLELSPAYLDHVDFFSPTGFPLNGTGFTRVSTGDLHPFSSRARAHRNFAFPIELPTTGPQDVYLRIQTRSTAQAQLALWTNDTFERNAHADYFWQGILLGLMVLILHMSFTHWQMLRQRFALLLFGQILATLLAYQGINGTVAEFLSPEQALVGDLATSLGSCLMMAFTLWFFLDFFRLHEIAPRIARYYQLCMGVAFLAALAAPTDYYAQVAPLMYFLALLSMPLTLYLSYRTPETVVLGRRWVFWGYLIFSVSPITSLLIVLGVLPTYDALSDLPQFSAVLQLIFLLQAVQVRVEETENLRHAAEIRAFEAETRTSDMAVQRGEQSKFLSLIAHELKTPLTVIDSAIQAIQYAQTSNRPLNVAERHERIRDAVFRLNTLLEEALSQERAAHQALTPRCQATDLTTLFAEINRLTPSPLKILNAYPRYCHADRTLLRIALGNLADNARKYALADTPIELQVAAQSHQGLTGVIFSMRNQCAGPLPVDTREWFSKYYRASRNPDGVGLGLYLIRQIAEAHGGFARITTAPLSAATPTHQVEVSLWLPDLSTTEEKS